MEHSRLRVIQDDVMMRTTGPIIALLLLASACAGTRSQPDEQPTEDRREVLNLDPMLVRPSGGGDGEAIDVNELFDRAYRAFSARQYEEAATDYEAVIRYFPDSRFYLPSLYNAGLSYEKLEQWNDAVRVYRTIVEQFPENDGTTDAYYRLAGALEQTGAYEEVVELMTQVMLRPELSNFDRVEAHVRRSNALLQLGHYQEAADGFRNAIFINRDAKPDEQLADNSHFIVQCYFGMGRAYHHMVDDIALVLPPERMGEDLKKKAELFMSSQANYIRALSKHHTRWSVAAGYMIGRLYEDFYNDIFQAEIPDGLTDEQLSLYFEELRGQIRPLMERAVQVYEKNLSLSKRLMRDGTEQENEWVASTSRHLNRLRAYLEDPETQRRAERFVVSGRDLSMMWEPVGVAQDEVHVALRRATTGAKPKRVSAKSDGPSPEDPSPEN